MYKVVRIGIVLSLSCLCLLHIHALAATKFSFSKPNVWVDGMEVDVTSDSDKANFSLYSLKDDGEISTTYIFNVKPSFPELTSALKFHIEQKSTSDLWMDFILEDANKNKESLSVDGAVILHRDDSNNSEIVKLDNASLNLGSEFGGDIYVPLRYLKMNKSGSDEEKFDIKNLASTGFAFSLKGTASSKIEIKDLNSVSENDDPYFGLKLDAKIVGEDALPIPATAETISQYSIQGDQKNDFVFTPISGELGVAVTSDGVFKISQDAPEQSINISAKNTEGLYIRKKVNIYKSWVSVQDDQRLKIPLPNEIEAINNKYSIYSNPQVITIIRLVCIIAIFIFGVSYLISFRKFKG